MPETPLAQFLRDISVSHVSSVFPEGGLHALNLTTLNISGRKMLRSLPQKMHILLPSLESMRIQDCPELESFPERGLPPNLESLCHYNLSSLKTIDGEEFRRLNSLKTLQNCEMP